ncbi:MAG: DHH family phosphoesterase, partial [Oscillospiraceae bacterium]|nr:DHH family phosphoesterase [Oscillospiraceae bacterium]
ELIQLGGRQYKVFGSIVKTERSPGNEEFLATTYWIDLSEYAAIHSEFKKSRPISTILVLDNYEELLNGMSDKEKSALLASIDDRISTWAGNCGGYLCKYDRDRYFFLFEERYLASFIEGKFSVLDSVRELTANNGMHATVSIGIGKDGSSFDENFKFASLAMEMSLSRGGDQAVIKNRYNFEFYGGRSAEVEKRSKVKSRVMANAFGELLSDASIVFVMGHKNADLDTIGAAFGVCCLARSRGTKYRIIINTERNVAEPLVSRMKLLPEYRDVFISAQDAMIEADGKSLLVVVDTNRPEQTESESLLVSCNRVTVIDHHLRAATYIENADLNFHEPYASSASELVTEMLQYLVEKSSIHKYEAEALMAGIVLDTKSFAIRTGSRTFDAAAFLLRIGADTAEVKKLLQSDFTTTMTRYNIIRSAQIYKNGIAIAGSDTRVSRVLVAQAADELLNVAGVEASFVASPEGDGISISGRSIGNVNVQLILEKLGGGGNKSTAGVQITGKSMKEVLSELAAAIDAYIADSEHNNDIVQ